MNFYVINESDIDKCSLAGLVACWDEDLDNPIVVVCDESDQLFSDNATVTRD